MAVVAAIALMSAASAAFGGSIVNSKHNISSTGEASIKGGATDSSQICIYCHAPHNANLALPLWNRTNPAANTFTLYSGINMQSRQFATGFTSDSTSLFCMSCHDGATNMNAVSNQGALERGNQAGKTAPGDAGFPLVNAIITDTNLEFGSNLSKTHPINFPVPTTPQNNQDDLWLGAGSSMGGGTALPTTFPLFNTKADPGMSAQRTSNGRSLECGSCHAVHDSTISPFLRFTMSGSKLCLGCHNK